MTAGFAPLATPPYIAVIFAAQLKQDAPGYAAMADHMVALAQAQTGYLGHDSARDADGFGITVSYWRDLDAVASWRRNAEHLMAQKLGHDRWYEQSTLRVAEVTRSYDSHDFDARIGKDGG